jgi:molecular chaperone GrpE
MSEEEIQAEDYKDKYLRCLAEQDNSRKRLHKETQELLRYGIENAMADFFPVIDQFEQALRLAETSSADVKNWAVGFQMIQGQLKQILESQGIEPFSATGVEFNPFLHEAVEIVETLDHPDNFVIAEFTKGYKNAHRTLRPARVKVARRPKEPVQGETNE